MGGAAWASPMTRGLLVALSISWVLIWHFVRRIKRSNGHRPSVKVVFRCRCVCPGGSWGSHCKVLSRTFFGSGWAWVQPLPPCLPAVISLRILTLHPHSLLLYLGPLTTQSRRKDTPSTPAPMVAVQLMDGRPQVLVEGEAGPVKLEISTPLHDGEWHVIHLQLDSRGVVLMVDVCGRGWEESASESHCVARAAWPRGGALASWAMPGPMQLGGLAHDLPSPEELGWSEAPTTHPLDGCVSHLTVNGQVSGQAWK
ncbi:putative neural-cadherin 2 [Penaeus monodon]|uniref:putative neural-cadherin 2 n=1 Tax=Penaeus monodon TaxID=6687 RepID=UPI0018A6DA48|nr:putative neural-cadherin 2 [Penaeus monodon]